MSSLWIPKTKGVRIILNLDGDPFWMRAQLPCPISYFVVEFPLYMEREDVHRTLDERFRGDGVEQIQAFDHTRRNIFVVFGEKERLDRIMHIDFQQWNPFNELERNLPVIWGFGDITSNGHAGAFIPQDVDYIHYPRGFEPKQYFESPLPPFQGWGMLMRCPPYPKNY